MADNLVLGGFVTLPCLFAAGLSLFFGRYRVHAGGRRRWLRLIAGNALVLLFLISIVLAGGECYYRFFYDASDAYLMSRTGEAWYGRHYKLNTSGLRDSQEVSPRRPAMTRRITFVGDSFLAGHGVADVEDRFANLIRPARPAWQVDVMAMPGWDTGDELASLKTVAGGGYELDLCVLVYNLNDSADQLPEHAEIARGRPGPPYLIEHSYFLDTLWVRWHVAHDPLLKNYFGYLPRSYEGEYWATQQKRLVELKDVVRHAGGRLVVVTFPFVDDLGPAYPYREIHAKLGAFWKRIGVPQLDLLPVLEPHGREGLTANRHDPHPNERAHALAAEAIQGFLDEEVRRAE